MSSFKNIQITVERYNTPCFWLSAKEGKFNVIQNSGIFKEKLGYNTPISVWYMGCSKGFFEIMNLS